MKKPFAETKLGQFVEKAKPIVGDALQFVGDLTGIEMIEKVGNFIDGKAEESAEAKALQLEFERLKLGFELEFQRLELEQFKAEVEDRNSARSREIQFMQSSGGKRDWVQGGLVIATMTLVFAALFYLAFYEIPKANERVFDMLLGGVIVSGSTSIYNYFFGSSRSSKHKDDILRDVVRK